MTDAGSMNAKVGAETKGFETGMKKVDDLMKSTHAKMQTFSKGVVASGEKVKGFGGHLGGLALKLTGVGAVLGIVSGILAGFTLKSAIDATTELGSAAWDLHNKFGLTGESATGLIYAFGSEGVGAEMLSKGLKGLSKNLDNLKLSQEQHLRLTGEAASESGIFSAALHHLNLKLTDTKGKVVPLDEAVLRIADKFAKLGPEIDKSTLAQDLFGKSGGDMIEVLIKGRKGILELEATAKHYGLILSTENLAQVDAYVDKHKEMDLAMQGIKVTIGMALMPILTQLAQKFLNVTTTMIDWIHKHPEVIASLQNLAQAGVNFVTSAIQGLVAVIGGPGQANDAIDNMAGKAEMAHSQLAGKDGLATAITNITDNLSSFLNSPSTKDFIQFWTDVGNVLGTIASWLNTIDSFLNGIVEKENQLGGWIRGHQSPSTVPAGIGPKGPLARPHAAGLDYVPYDNYRALLHRGERVVPASENRRASRGAGTTVLPVAFVAIPPSREQAIAMNEAIRKLQRGLT